MKNLNMPMKKYKYNLVLSSVLLLMAWSVDVVAQGKAAADKLIFKLSYFNVNNSTQYLVFESLMRTEHSVLPQIGKEYEIFLGDTSAPVAKIITDKHGKANAVIPPSLKQAWEASSQHIFLVKEGDKELISDYTINKAKITIDTTTADTVHSITATVQTLKDGKWVPAADVEMKLGIKRLGGILPAGDDETLTTDSSGTVTTELKKLNLPGDSKGNYLLMAQVEDNDLYGNIIVEKSVPWGTVPHYNADFFKERHLWSTGRHAPLWLVSMALFIMITVWGTLIYLVFQMIKIKKLGVGKTA